MSSVALTGQLTAAPPTSGGGAFPGATFNFPVELNPASKASNVFDGGIPVINSPSPAFVALPALGPAGTVTKGNFLYFRCKSPMRVRLTMTDTPVPLVQEVFVNGLLTLEFPDSNPLVLLEVQGSGQIEYLVSGNL